jgi:hypothetical protein
VQRERSKPAPPEDRREQKSLPFEPVEHALDGADMPCAACGKNVCEWAGQHEETEEIDVVERCFVLKRHIRKKYRCQCGAAPVTADGPVRMPGGACIRWTSRSMQGVNCDMGLPRFGDMTFIWTEQGWVYLALLIDLCIVGTMPLQSRRSAA